MASTFRYETQVFRDADEHAEALRDWDQRYEQLTPGRFEGHITQTWLEGIQIFRETTREVVDQSGSAWPGAITVGLVQASSEPAHFMARSLAPGDGFVFGPPGEFNLRTARQFDVIGLAVPAATLRSFSCGSDDSRAGAWESVQPVLLLRAEPLRMLQSLCAAYFEAIGQDQSCFQHEAARASMRDQLLAALVDVSAAGTGHTPSAGPRKKLVRDAIEFVRQRCRGPVTVLELCQALMVSRRSLQYCFQEEMGVSPVQYLRAVRLNGVRRELKSSTAGARVWEVAARWGFWHQGQFARDYRNMFGELPSHTLRTTPGREQKKSSGVAAA